MDWSDALSAAIGSVFGGGATATVINAISRRRITRVEAADQLADAAIELLNTVKADTRADLSAMRAELADSRREAAENRRESAELRLAIRTATVEAEALTAYLHRVVSAIQDPSMTMERLRIMVGTGPPGPNGGSIVRLKHTD